MPLYCKWTLTPGFALACMVLLAPPAMAQTANTPSAVSETQGATTGLGSSHRFRDSASAAAHCSGDTVVWSAGPNLTYELPGAATYGKGGGFYACKMEADSAGFHAGS